MKVKVCMPDLVPVCYIGMKEALSLKYNQGEIVEVVEAGNSFIWDSTAFPKGWFKVVEETPYQKWQSSGPPEGVPTSLKVAFYAGRDSLEPALKRCESFLQHCLDSTDPKHTPSLQFIADIKKELER